MTPPAVKVAAERLGLPVIQPTKLRPPEVAAGLAATGAELAVVVAYGRILPPAILTAFPRGCVNVHGSLLPAYRGAAPIQWAVIDGNATTGVTIMQLDEGMDTGPTLATRALAIGPWARRCWSTRWPGSRRARWPRRRSRPPAPATRAC